MAPLKRFASYSKSLSEALEILSSEQQTKAVKKAITIIKKVHASAAKYAGEAEEGPKKPRKLNAYMQFAKENREAVKAKNPSAGVTDIAIILGQMWQQQKDSYKPKTSSAPKAKAAPKVKAAPKPRAPKTKKSGLNSDSDNEY